MHTSCQASWFEQWENKWGQDWNRSIPPNLREKVVTSNARDHVKSFGTLAKWNGFNLIGNKPKKDYGLTYFKYEG